MDRIIEFTASSRRDVKISFLNARCVRVQIAPPKKENAPSPLNTYDFISERFDEFPLDGGLRGDSWRIASEALSLEGNDNSVKASLPDGSTLFELNRIDFSSVSAEAFFAADPGEDWCGFGDQTRERLFHRGHTAVCQVSNVTSYLPVPFFMSTRGYGILVNTTCKVEFDLGKRDPEVFSWNDRRGVIDFYLFAAPSFKELIRLYTALTGAPKLPPLWSFGLWYICRTQANDAEVVNDALNFRRSGIPCDLIGLEPGWMEKNYDQTTGKAWSSERFPLPDWQKKCQHTFIKALQRMGFHLELWLCNDYDLSLEEERRAKKKLAEKERSGGAFHAEAEQDEHFSHPVFLDKTTKRSEAWFEHLKKFVDWGADFFKQDGAYQVCDHPDRLFGNGMTDAEMHNLYPLCYNRQMYEGFAEYTNRRPVVFTVSGWTGFQSYCGTWTGDTGGRLETLGAMLNTAMMGHSWATNDMEVMQKEGIHFGYLQPWSQINSWTYFRMPWVQGDELFAMHQFYGRLRARLIPYIYSWARAATLDSVPLMRPLILEFQDDPACRNVLHEYLLGRDLLVGVYKSGLHLPAGRWQDLWSGRIYQGGVSADIPWPGDRGGALLLREGGIVPFGPVMQYRGEKPLDELEWRLFPGTEKSAFELYEDDGVTFDYREGKFTVSTMAVSPKESGWTILLDDAMPGRKHSLRVTLGAAPKHVENNGAAVKWSFDAKQNELVVLGVKPGTIVIES